MKNFALIGAAGFIAPRHMKAVKETGNQIVAAVDKFDSVGILDSYFPGADFFTEFERFDRHVEKLRIKNNPIDYVSVCSPNYLHDSHIRFGLRNHCDVICEKPLVLNPWNVKSLIDQEKEYGKRVYNILQLRLHPAIIQLKKIIDESASDKFNEVELTYITSRGNWYYSSWKGDLQKSGGIATNIGIHFFDMLSWIFGEVKFSQVHLHEFDRAAGILEFANARVKWFLSISSETLPDEVRATGKQTFRSLTMNDNSIEFSDGFTDLHTESYKLILSGNGFGLQEAQNAIEIAHKIRNTTPVGLKGEYHPFANNKLRKHPFENAS
jgi:UDP-N-acetyl-2-amino-2-deoxyglucuronate dehydrogenase